MSDGVTDPGTDNEVMVSPSFMVASQLGGDLLSHAGECGEPLQGVCGGVPRPRNERGRPSGRLASSHQGGDRGHHRVPVPTECGDGRGARRPGVLERERHRRESEGHSGGFCGNPLHPGCLRRREMNCERQLKSRDMTRRIRYAALLGALFLAAACQREEWPADGGMSASDGYVTLRAGVEIPPCPRW